jgi:hypothetical protein
MEDLIEPRRAPGALGDPGPPVAYECLCGFSCPGCYEHYPHAEEAAWAGTKHWGWPLYWEHIDARWAGVQCMVCGAVLGTPARL